MVISYQALPGDSHPDTVRNPGSTLMRKIARESLKTSFETHIRVVTQSVFNADDQSNVSFVTSPILLGLKIIHWLIHLCIFFVSRTFTVLSVSFITGLANALVRSECVLADSVDAAVVYGLHALVHIWREREREHEI